MFITICHEALTGSISSVLQMAVIVIPLMIFIEIFKDLNLLDRLTAIMTPVTRIIGISRDGNLPLLAGLLFGLSYGSGIIIQCAREGRLKYLDIFLINLFLVICHSVLEDTLLFAAIGSQWLPVLLMRLALAAIICYFYRLFYCKRNLNYNLEASDQGHSRFL
ncbi:MAG TPA: nucleoside recognition domain-containing protein [Syntrophomonadaceae bacterium]|nr:nucleoside recognition domain-containing protein [Syntrophomonadaceae bacterium]